VRNLDALGVGGGAGIPDPGTCPNASGGIKNDAWPTIVVGICVPPTVDIEPEGPCS